MGACAYCFTQRDPTENMILEKEEILKMKKFTIDEIKNSFFDRNDKETISYNNAIKGFKKLHFNNKQEFLDKDSQILKTFHSVLRGVSMNPGEKDLKKTTFHYKRMMIFLFFLSNSYCNDKIQEVMKMEKKQTLNQEDVEVVMKEIFNVVLDCSYELLVQDIYEGKKQMESRKLQNSKAKINPLVQELIKEIFSKGKPEKSSIELGSSYFYLSEQLDCNIAATYGIRQIIKQKLLQEKQEETLPPQLLRQQQQLGVQLLQNPQQEVKSTQQQQDDTK